MPSSTDPRGDERPAPTPEQAYVVAASALGGLAGLLLAAFAVLMSVRAAPSLLPLAVSPLIPLTVPLLIIRSRARAAGRASVRRGDRALALAFALGAVCGAAVVGAMTAR